MCSGCASNRTYLSVIYTQLHQKCTLKGLYILQDSLLFIHLTSGWRGTSEYSHCPSDALGLNHSKRIKYGCGWRNVILDFWGEISNVSTWQRRCWIHLINSNNISIHFFWTQRDHHAMKQSVVHPLASMTASLHWSPFVINDRVKPARAAVWLWIMLH